MRKSRGMVGSELAPYADYLLQRAQTELDVRPRISGLANKLAPIFLRVFGIPEIGVQLRILHALRYINPAFHSVVDVGCGSGILLGAIHRAYPNANLVGIEIDPISADIARAAHAYAQVLTGDAVKVTTTLKTQFDCAVSIDVLEHVPDAELADFFAAFNRLLRPGGTLIIHVPATDQRRTIRSFENWSHHDHEREGFEADDLRRLLSSAGFKTRTIKPTFGFLASLAWECNMLIAGTPVQALGFPPLLLMARLGELLKSSKYNGVLCVAEKRL